MKTVDFAELVRLVAIMRASQHNFDAATIEEYREMHARFAASHEKDVDEWLKNYFTSSQ